VARARGVAGLPDRAFFAARPVVDRVGADAIAKAIGGWEAGRPVLDTIADHSPTRLFAILDNSSSHRGRTDRAALLGRAPPPGGRHDL
jgi:hypothetical protein